MIVVAEELATPPGDPDRGGAGAGVAAGGRAGFWATDDEGVRGTSVTEGQVWAARHSEAGEFPMRVEKVGRHGDGEPFAATISHSGVRLWDVSPSALQVAPDLHSGQILNIGLVSDHDDGSALVTLGSEGKIRLWDAMTGDLLSTRSCPTDSAARLLVRIDDGGPRAVWAGDSGVIDTAMTGLPSQHALPVGSFSSIAQVGPDLLLVGLRNSAQLRHAASGQLIAELGLRSGAAHFVAGTRFDDGVLMVSGTDTGDLTVWHWNREHGATPLVQDGGHRVDGPPGRPSIPSSPPARSR